MPSEQEGALGGGESANASGNQPTSLPLFGVQPQNILPVEIIANTSSGFPFAWLDRPHYFFFPFPVHCTQRHEREGANFPSLLGLFFEMKVRILCTVDVIPL
jgi:hypothetical protein